MMMIAAGLILFVEVGAVALIACIIVLVDY